MGRWVVVGALAVAALSFHGADARQEAKGGKTYAQVLADCDPATGLPFGQKPVQARAAPQHVILNPFVLIRPDAKAVEAAYPPAAKAAHVGGKVVMKCALAVDGRPQDCEASEETPPGYGFGAAGKTVVEQMLFVPQRKDCIPVAGAKVSVPVSFSLP